MCKRSHVTGPTRDPKFGERLNITTVETHSDNGTVVGGFDGDPGPSSADKAVMACAVCTKTGQKLTLVGIPASFQQSLGLGAAAIATFTQTREWWQDDILRFDNGKVANLKDLNGVGIAVLVGEFALDDPKVTDELRLLGIQPDGQPIDETKPVAAATIAETVAASTTVLLARRMASAAAAIVILALVIGVSMTTRVT